MLIEIPLLPKRGPDIIVRLEHLRHLLDCISKGSIAAVHTERLPTQQAVRKKISADIGDDSPADEPMARRRRSLPPALHFMAACWNGRQP